MNAFVTKILAETNVGCGSGGGFNISLPNCGKSADQSVIVTAVKISSEIAAAVCLLIIVLGGLRYIISAGNPESVKRSKDTLIYAVVGLVVSISAFTIVSFVVGKV